MYESPLYLALAGLDPDQLFVVVSYYWGSVSERQIAEDLTELRGTAIGRDRVHRIRLTAESKLERRLSPLLEGAA